MYLGMIHLGSCIQYSTVQYIQQTGEREREENPANAEKSVEMDLESYFIYYTLMKCFWWRGID